MNNRRRPNPLRLTCLILALALGWVPAAPGRAQATPARATLVALAPGSRLLFFASSRPSVLERALPVTGLPPNTHLAGLDFRPADQRLYALGITDTADNDTGSLFVIELDTGQATRVGAAPFSSVLADLAQYGFDFDPVNDWIRVVNTDDQNLRVNPDTGALRGLDAKLDNAADTEEIAAVAYDRSRPRAIASTLYGLDFDNDELVRLGDADDAASAWNGKVTTIGSLQLQTQTRHLGFDISDADGTAYVSLSNLATLRYGLYTVNLTTGQAAFSGLIGDGTTEILGLAAMPTRRVYFPIVGR